MNYTFNTVSRLLQLSKENNMPIHEIMIQKETAETEKSRDEIIELMSDNLKYMNSSMKTGLKGVSSVTGLTGFDALRMKEYINKGKGISGKTMLNSVCYSLAVNETNASMGIICASPTAGSCGVLPGVLFGIKDKLNMTKDDMINFLFAAGAFGIVIANNASISGAEGGCQAEVGSASAMAAAAAVLAAGGTNKQASHACAIALKNLLGLVCDPVAGLVEVPCIKRNAIGTSNAVISCDMALSGIESKIPCDEVISAMGNIGRDLPVSLKETAIGGLAGTPTGKQIKKQVNKM